MDKMKIGGKNIVINELNFEEAPVSAQVYSFIKSYLNRDMIEVKTSGSTGTPKTVYLRKENMRASARATIEALKLKSGDRILLCLSTDHIAGKMMVARWAEGDFDLYVTEASAQPLQQIEGSFNFSAMVPYQVQASLSDLHRIDKLIIGGGTIDGELERKLQDVPGEVYHTYGMTETISHVALRKVNGKERTASFKALPGVSFTIDERNCLVINAPEIGVGRLVTNDIVELVNEFNFIWKGRYDNVINSAGIKLQPEVIERKIKGVEQAFFVFGLKDKTWGEKLVLLVEGMDVPAFDFSELDSYERPKEILCLPQFIRTANGKIKRKETAALLNNN